MPSGRGNIALMLEDKAGAFLKSLTQKRFWVPALLAVTILIAVLFWSFAFNIPRTTNESSTYHQPNPQAGVPLAWEYEPLKHKQAREQITAKSSSYHPDQVMEWYLIRVSPSGDPSTLDMVTCTYILLPPGKEVQGDIDAFVEIFNPDTTRWENQATINEMVVEYARFGFANQKIELQDGRVFEFPEIVGEDIKQIGYLTFRIKV